MATFEKSGKPKKVGRPKGSTKSKTKTKTKTTSGSKTKGGNFLGAVGELIAPTGWESFVTTAALVGIDRADAALRRGKEGKKSVKKMSGGAEGERNSLGNVNEIKKILKGDALDNLKPIHTNDEMWLKSNNEKPAFKEKLLKKISDIDEEILKRQELLKKVDEYMLELKVRKEGISYFKNLKAKGILEQDSGVNIKSSEKTLEILTKAINKYTSNSNYIPIKEKLERQIEKLEGHRWVIKNILNRDGLLKVY